VVLRRIPFVKTETGLWYTHNWLKWLYERRQIGQNRGRPPNPIPNPISNPKSYPNPDPNPITNPIPNRKPYPNPIPNPKPNPKCYRNRVRWSPTVLPTNRILKQRSCHKSIQSGFCMHTINCTARVIFGGDCRDHVTPLLRDKLLWLRERERITFKLCLLVYKAINGLAPSFLQDLCMPVTTVSTHAALRSAARGDLVVPRTRRRLGNRAFCVAGPSAWNSLPSDIRTASCVTTFKNLLKTHLFIQSYYAT